LYFYETPLIVNKYIVYTLDGGEIRCSEVELKKGLLEMKTDSGVIIELDEYKIEKIERYQTINRKTKLSVWRPSNG
jgi:hypothetical protein